MWFNLRKIQTNMDTCPRSKGSTYKPLEATVSHMGMSASFLLRGDGGQRETRSGLGFSSCVEARLCTRMKRYFTYKLAVPMVLLATSQPWQENHLRWQGAGLCKGWSTMQAEGSSDTGGSLNATVSDTGQVLDTELLMKDWTSLNEFF